MPLPQAGPAQICAIGVGGGGSNAIMRMMRARPVPGVTYACVNTDLKALSQVDGAHVIHIGENLTRGLGAGGDPEKGAMAANESKQALKNIVGGADLVFLAIGMGGGTGTGAAPIVAELAKRHGALTVGVVTLPFMFEGRPRQRNAATGLQELQQHVDTLIVIHNDRLLAAVPASAPMTEAFALADEMLVNGVKSITELVTTTGLINVDFADVRSVMENAGTAMMGVGIGSGENRMLGAVEEAMRDPLSDKAVTGARGVLLNFRGGPDMSIQEISAAAEVVSATVDTEANIIFGASIDPAIQEEVQVTLIATGLPGEQPQRADRRSPAPSDSFTREPEVEASREEVEVEDLDLPAFVRRRRRSR
jgi:cell division protein FtsZ